MKSTCVLPEGYEQFYTIDLQKDKKMSLLVNFIAIVIAVAMIVPAAIYVPIAHLFSVEQGLSQYLIRFGALLGLIVLYMVLHELVHGVAMKLCGTKKVKYGFTGLYAFAGSEDYYKKGPYIFIALAPVVLWGAVIAMVNCMVPVEWFWIIYFLQVTNLSGAAGDLFVTVKFSRFPKDILIKDHGVGMTVYSKTNEMEYV
jgi:hypothetical protein